MNMGPASVLPTISATGIYRISPGKSSHSTVTGSVATALRNASGSRTASLQVLISCAPAWVAACCKAMQGASV